MYAPLIVLPYTDEQGRTNGRGSMLSKSQAYPAPFGRAVAGIVRELLKEQDIGTHYNVMKSCDIYYII